MLRKASADKLDKTRYKPLGVESPKEKISVSYKLFFENTKQKTDPEINEIIHLASMVTLTYNCFGYINFLIHFISIL